MNDELAGRQGLRMLLDDAELASLGEIATHRVVEARQDVFTQGGGGDYIYVILEGWAGRYRDLPDGRRQYLALHLPGDVCDLDRVTLGAVDFGIVALTACTVARIALIDLQRAFNVRPRLALVFWWMLSAENAIACAWASALGRQTARERLAHFLCEIAVRLGGEIPVAESIYPLLMTQEDLATALGLSSVHLNRSLQTLRADGLLEVKARQMQILDWEGLSRIGDFDPAYLHRDGPGSVGAASLKADTAAKAVLWDAWASWRRRSCAASSHGVRPSCAN